jgi:hypothetical protein
MKKIIPLALASAFFLAGCASSIHTIGNNVYVASKTGGGFSSTSGLLDDLYEDATKFCAEKGGEFNLLDQGAQGGNLRMYSPGANGGGTGFAAGLSRGLAIPMGSYPQASIRFTCDSGKKEVAPSQAAAEPGLYLMQTSAGDKVYLLPKIEPSANGLLKFYTVLIFAKEQNLGDGVVVRSFRDEFEMDCKNQMSRLADRKYFEYGDMSGKSYIGPRKEETKLEKYGKGSFFEKVDQLVCPPK